jgi:plastocyanin
VSKLGSLLLVALFALLALAAGAPSAVRADPPVLNAVVGAPTSPDAFKIALTDATGATVAHLDPGTYTISVKDYASEHNFHLTGPGVDEATDVTGTASTTWTVTFVDGTYRFVCDAHVSSMHGSFTVGVPPIPRPRATPKLLGRVGPGRSISLRTASGTRVATTAAGKYELAIRDSSRTDDFHLSGPGVNRRTSLRGRASVTWGLRLAAGTYRYRSDAHPALRGSFRVR